MVRRRGSRQDAIKEIVRTKRLRLQREVLMELRDRGFSSTQATISRDMKDMDIRRRPDGTLILAEDQRLQHMVCEFVTAQRRASNLVYIECELGAATGVAAALEALGLPHVIGCVSDNRGVLVVTTGDEGAKQVVKLIKELRHPRSGRRQS